jgi:hypothetical protein
MTKSEVLVNAKELRKLILQSELEHQTTALAHRAPTKTGKGARVRPRTSCLGVAPRVLDIGAGSRRL